MYEFYKEYCICPACTVYLGLRDASGNEVGAWPVTVYNVNDVAIGTANTKEQYIALWNADPANAAVGRLSGLVGPFSFQLEGKCAGYYYGYLGPGGISVITGGSQTEGLLSDPEGDQLLVDPDGTELLFD